MTSKDKSACGDFVKGLTAGVALEMLTPHNGTTTPYIVIATAKGLKLALTAKFSTGRVLLFLLRVRVEKAEDWANLDEAGALFGVPTFEEKAGGCHMSTDYGRIVGYGHENPYDVGKRFMGSTTLAEMVAEIFDAVKKATPHLVMEDQEKIVDALTQRLTDIFPATPMLEYDPKENSTMHKGAKALHAAMSNAMKLQSEHYKKQFAAQEAPKQ